MRKYDLHNHTDGHRRHGINDERLARIVPIAQFHLDITRRDTTADALIQEYIVLYLGRNARRSVRKDCNAGQCAGIGGDLQACAGDQDISGIHGECNETENRHEHDCAENGNRATPLPLYLMRTGN